MARELLSRIIEEAGLKGYADVLQAAAADAIRITPAPIEEHRLPLGASRVGGMPDLAPDQEWPHWSNGPQSFIAQIELADLAGYPVAAVLPNAGWLSFFYNSAQDTWGFDPKDRGSFRVLYTPPGTVRRRDLPPGIPSHGVFDLCAAHLSADVSLPAYDAPAFAAAGLASIPEASMEELQERLDEVLRSSGRSMLFGHPDQVQSEMQTECAMVTGGLYCGDQSGYRDPRAAGLRGAAPEWRLLLQVASEEDASMMWGDLGCLYYWMRQQDLAARSFENAWMILQCH